MKYAPRKVFILENGGYIELTYEEFISRKQTDQSYEDKLFIPVQGYLLETDRNHYDSFYSDKERARYLKRLDKENGLLSIDAFDDDDNGTDFIPDYQQDVAETVADSLLKEHLLQCLDMLSDEERLLIEQYYYDGISETDLAPIYGITQQAISKRIKKIHKKLKFLLEN